MPGVPQYVPQTAQSPPPPPPDTNEGRDRDEESKIRKEYDTLIQERETLRALIRQQEDERIAREKAIEAEALAKKMRAEQEALKAREIAAAVAAAKEKAERAAEGVAKKAREESDKKLAEVEAARLELEKKDSSMVKELEAIRDLLRQQGAGHVGTRKRLKLPTWIRA